MARLVGNRLAAASVVIAGLVLAATATASRVVDLRAASPTDQIRATERSGSRVAVLLLNARHFDTAQPSADQAAHNALTSLYCGA
jgi:hypothetical protein